MIPLTKNVTLEEDTPTLVVIDEIQESSEAIKLLRYFYKEMPQLHLISVGSLLEFVLKDVKNFRVGRIEYLYLSPFNFIELMGVVSYHGYTL